MSENKIIIIFLCILVPIYCFSNDTKSIFVSSKHKKRNSNILVVRTLEEALDSIQNKKNIKTINIVLEEGKHILDETLCIKDAKNKIIIKGEKNNSYITSEKTIENSILRIENDIICFPVEKDIFSLMINGEVRHMSHSINQEKPQYMSQFTSFINEKEKNTYSAIFKKEEIEKMEIGCYIYIYCKWLHYKLKVVSIDINNQRVYMQGMNLNTNYIKQSNSVYYSIYNSRKTLTPGTFCSINKNIYYKLNKNEIIHNLKITIPQLTTLIVVSNCNRGVEFRNINFTNANTNSLFIQESQSGVNWPEAISIMNSKNITFYNCKFFNNLGYSIGIKQNSEYCEIKRCHFYNLGAGAIKLGDCYQTDKTNHISIENNLINGYGFINASSAGILVTKANRITITHNTICNGYYTGISIGWTWGYGTSYSYSNYVANNHIHHLLQCVLSDGAGIYTLGKQEGTIIENNYIHDIVSRVNTASGSSLIYFDEGTSNVIARNNICFGSHTGFHEHYGKCNIIKNNLFAYNNIVGIRLSNHKKDSLLTIDSNIIIVDCGTAYNSTLTQYAILNNNKSWFGEVLNHENGLNTYNTPIKVKMNVKNLYKKKVIKQKFKYGVYDKYLIKKSKLTNDFLNKHNAIVRIIFPTCSHYFRRTY